MLPFGKRVRIWRSLRGLSQVELSQISQSRLDQAVIARHESALRTAPRSKTILVYADALGIPSELLTGEKGGEWVLQDIFRPLSPWKRLPSETCNRISADLKALLPEILADLGLKRALLYHCELGSVALLTGGPHKLIVVLPPGSTQVAQVISAVIAAGCDAGVTTGEIPVQLYLSMLLDPVASLQLPGLPEGLQLDAPLQIGDRHRPPRQTTEVYLEILGDGEDILRRIEQCLAGEQILRLEVRRPETVQANLPDEIREYLSHNNLDLDDDGRLKPSNNAT